MRAMLIGAATAAIGLGLVATACASDVTSASGRSSAVSGAGATASTGSSGSGGSPAASPAPTPTASIGSRAAARTSGIVGTGCPKMPATGPGSFTGMAGEPVATAASHDPHLTDLARAIRVAGLTGTLNSAKSVTVFAPDNAAFASLGSGNVSTLLASKADLRKVLEYHVVSGRKSPADLARSATLPTLAGTSLYPVKSDGVYRINNATVVCGNVRTANATVYIINKILIP